MQLSRGSELAGFDADAAMAAGRDAAGDALRVGAEFTAADYRLLYARGDVLAEYGREGIGSVGDRVHDYIHLDFAEREMYEEILPVAERTRAFVTLTDAAVVVRLFVGEEGLFLSLDPGTPVDPVVSAVEESVAAAEAGESA